MHFVRGRNLNLPPWEGRGKRERKGGGCYCLYREEEELVLSPFPFTLGESGSIGQGEKDLFCAGTDRWIFPSFLCCARHAVDIASSCCGFHVLYFFFTKVVLSCLLSSVPAAAEILRRDFLYTKKPQLSFSRKRNYSGIHL